MQGLLNNMQDDHTVNEFFKRTIHNSLVEVSLLFEYLPNSHCLTLRKLSTDFSPQYDTLNYYGKVYFFDKVFANYFL